MKRLVGALVLVVVLAVACSGSGETTATPATTQQTPTPAAQPNAAPAQSSATPTPTPAAQPAAMPVPAPTAQPAPQAAPAPAPTPAPIAAPQGGATSPAPQQSVPAVKTIAVEMANLSFKPGVISIKLSEAVRFAATNKDSVTHSFSFSVPGGGGYDVIVNGGQSKNGDPITISNTGKIEFFCQFHAGMTGSLDVAASTTSPAASTSGYDY
ncbi:MAG: hypothetical protein EXR47_07825 [Dehalococcoidia bacterium]|nr:hypothetical protein [Dehalococcoidia bacterium]